MSRGAHRRRNHTRAGAADSLARQVELRVVHQVEGFGSQLQVNFFASGELLKN